MRARRQRRDSGSLGGQASLQLDLETPAIGAVADEDDPFTDDPPSPVSPSYGSDEQSAPVPAPTLPAPQPPLAPRGDSGNGKHDPSDGAPATPGEAAPGIDDGTLIASSTVKETYRESVRSILDEKTWEQKFDPGALIYTARVHGRATWERERARKEPIRKLVQERQQQRPDELPWAGYHEVPEADLLEVACRFLYNGLTEAVCGAYIAHETVPLSIAQAGICVVGYSGRHDQWYERLLRRELLIELDDPLAEAEAVLGLRDRWSRPGTPDRLHQLSELARRGFVSYMERRIMLTQCEGKWKIGYGQPAPLELLTGMGNMELLEMSLELLRALLLDDPRWVFVSQKSREVGLQSIADTLKPFEFTALTRLQPRLEEQIRIGHYPDFYLRKVVRFVEEVTPHLVLGAFRAGAFSPPRFFVAHEERVFQAAVIAMADSLATQPVGIPALVRLAQAGCRAAIGADSFEQLIQQAYREAGAPEWFYRGEIR
jgi:hypothetical protein